MTERFKMAAVVPVVVLDDAKDAVATANALLAGGVDVMEITFRTAAAADSIKAVAEGCPDMLVGAGTVITLEQCKKAVDCGAKFIVSPGFDEEVVRWCVENGVAVTPGCVTPTEIMAAMKLGLNVLPGGRLRRSVRDEGPVRPIWRDQIPPDRRRQRAEHRRIHRRAVHPRRRRQLGLPKGGHCGR